MKNNLLLILKSSDIVKDLAEEFKKPFGWLKFKEKREYKKLRQNLLESIDSLIDDKWTVDYLINFEYIIISYYSKLKPYMDNFYIRDWDDISKINKFKPICITSDHDEIYTIEIITNNITFTIFNIYSGNTTQIIAGNEVGDTQRNIELECKKVIINILKNYIDDNIYDYQIE